MSVRIFIDNYIDKTPFLNQLMHMADAKGNNNAMLDSEEEVSAFLKLAKEDYNAKTLSEQGIRVNGNGSVFSVTKTKDDTEAKLLYDLPNDKIQERSTYGNMTVSAEYIDSFTVNGEVLYKGHSIQGYESVDGAVSYTQNLSQALNFPSYSHRKVDKQFDKAKTSDL